MLSINQCTFSYKRKGKPTINNFSLRLLEGGVYGLLGSNGAGKSTLLQLICGLLTPDSGEILLDDMNTRRRLPIVQSEIMLVPEEIEFPPLHLYKYVELSSKFYPRFSDEELRRHLATFGIEDNPRLDQLSMGQKKKVALAYAMACNTKVLLMDEPTNGLDIPGKSNFRKFVAEAMNDDRIIVISTHQVKDVSRILDHILIMDNSEVILNHSVNEIIDHMKFVETTKPESLPSPYYIVKGIAGAAAIIPNTDGDDSEINLELLFGFATEQPEKINSIFTSNNR